MVRLIIIAIASFSSAVFGAPECSDELLAALPAERAEVMANLKTLTRQISLISRVAGREFVEANMGTSLQTIETQLQTLAEDITNQTGQPRPTAELAASLAQMEAQFAQALKPRTYNPHTDNPGGPKSVMETRRHGFEDDWNQPL